MVIRKFGEDVFFFKNNFITPPNPKLSVFDGSYPRVVIILN